ncbi:NADH:flavin oxidoreductase/NADH oxidase [Microbacterium candidum]|uniref:NADH:flavin oxidoreductase/NADH oxidase n=1 Tax=Microbacterium candidum TaxID=3041922 RepID=A0ABT7MY32_9MICO|nr:NADH:flavin oxidoreductase/NADH oxidase [Microbacterium sp. ASV49]MDL9979346.1 NADH:flavin oxidoreductase/NADH oxidase [Microbacterium sp. ASV49]
MSDVDVLHTPLSVGPVELSHRVAVSPMCMYASVDGHATDFHLVHLGRFALGGAALTMVEATAVEPQGRISHHDLGLWSDDHIPGLQRIAGFLAAHGSVPGIQLSHAGRRASVREPWRAGAPLDETDAAAGLPPWPVEGPSALPAGPGWPIPAAMDIGDIRRSIERWRDAAARAVAAGFRVIELHGAHGYLLHEFLSPIANQRTDAYGGTTEGRMRYPLEVVAAVREAIGPETALAYRLSAVDGAVGGLDLDDTAAFAARLQDAGVDLIDVSSGGISTDRSLDTRIRRGFAFHADFSHRIRESVDIPVATVGLVVEPEQAQELVTRADADLVLLGRSVLDDPNWPHHARVALGDDEFAEWDVRYGHALAPRARLIGKLAATGESPMSRFE